MQGKRNRPIYTDSHFVRLSGYFSRFLLFSLLGLILVGSLGQILEATEISDFLIGFVWPLLGKLMGVSIIGIGAMAFLESIR